VQRKLCLQPIGFEDRANEERHLFNTQTKRLVWGSVIALIATGLLTVAYHYFTAGYQSGIQPEMLKRWVTKLFYYPVRFRLQETVFTSAFIIVLGTTLLLERIIPAQKDQRIFSVSLFQDGVWFFYEPILHAFITATYVALLKIGYDNYFAFLTFDEINNLPEWIRFLFAVLLTDFLFWLQHWLNHKVPGLWEFHVIHHSQTEINFFTDYRYHFVEYLVRNTVLVIPFLVLDFDVPEVVLFSFFISWYTRFYHGNIRTNLGPLRYILVTPQSHRIHHSREHKHYNINYGSLFSVWDFLFRTQYKSFDEYPKTGVPTSDIPLEKNYAPLKLVTTPARQLIYPFLKLLKR
jgi:sterol desaturase/sphingolipid hydroxylase (fatty acid hydroxylase superfamily)